MAAFSRDYSQRQQTKLTGAHTAGGGSTPDTVRLAYPDGLSRKCH